MIIKAVYNLAMFVAAMILFVTSIPLLASMLDDRMTSSAGNSCDFETYLKGDSVNIQFNVDTVTLMGTIS